MWPFTRTYTLEKSGIMNGLVDIHSHILPGVDDGIKEIKESFNVLKTYEKLGVDTLWFTPHIMEDVPNTTDGLRRCFDWIVAQYQGPLKLRLGAENMLDNLFEQRIAVKDVLPVGEKRNHLLIETSYFTPPRDLNEKISKTFTAGFFPLLAHPERYVYMDLEQYDDLHERGVKMQLNLSSIFGFYGKEAQAKAKYILENGYYNAIGSDTHRYSQVAAAIEKGRLSKSTLNMLRMIPGID